MKSLTLNKYQARLEKVEFIINTRAEEVGYSYLGNMQEMLYLFDKKAQYLELRNKYRELADKLTIKELYRGKL